MGNRERLELSLYLNRNPGKLVQVDRKACMRCNPATEEAINISVRKVVKSSIMRAAKDAIPGKK